MNLKTYFQTAIDKKASDLHLVGEEKPVIRVNGELEELSNEKLEAKSLQTAIFSDLLTPEQIKQFEAIKELDFSYNHSSGLRLRINLHYQSGVIGLAARLIPKEIPTPEEIGLDENIYSLTHLKDGLVIVSGPAGCGKSTTLAVMIELINRERRAHIITIEDPIEFIFKDKQSIIEQRELGTDTDSFHSALKYVLRQDPNVIMVGEMRDLETVSAVLTAAETGHLVLTTLHTPTAPETINRIIDIFPPHKRDQVLIQLASTLRCVICQQMLPRKGGGRIVAREILIGNAAVANLIHQNKADQLISAMQTSRKEGMRTMTVALQELFKSGLIEEDILNRRTPKGTGKGTYY